MKIYNDEGSAVFEGSFTTDMLDMEHIDNQGDHLLVTIKYPEIKIHMSDVAWDFADSHDWITTDSSKTKVYLYVDFCDSSIHVQIESYPYLPPENEIQDEIINADSKDQDIVKGYYEKVKDYLNENNCGEFDTLKMELTNTEQKDLLWILLFKLA